MQAAIISRRNNEDSSFGGIGQEEVRHTEFK